MLSLLKTSPCPFSALELTHRPLGLLAWFLVAPSSQNTRHDQQTAFLQPGLLATQTCNRRRSRSRRPPVPSSDRGQTFVNSSALRPRRCVRRCRISSRTASRSSIHDPHLRAPHDRLPPSNQSERRRPRFVPPTVPSQVAEPFRPSNVCARVRPLAAFPLPAIASGTTSEPMRSNE
jgi:hypothetical protein